VECSSESSDSASCMELDNGYKIEISNVVEKVGRHKLKNPSELYTICFTEGIKEEKHKRERVMRVKNVLLY
jgi:hypothetical protein